MAWLRGSAVLVLFAAVALLTGCSAVVDHDQVALGATESVQISAGEALGQSFTAQHAGLNGVDVWLAPGQPGDGSIRLRLHPAPGSMQDLASAQLPLAQVVAPGFYRFTWPTLRRSNHSDLYLELTVEGAGQVAVGAGPATTYLDGALYRGGQAQDAQMTFRLAYDRPAALLGQVAAVGSALPVLGLVALLFVLPGWALLAWLWRGPALGWGEMLGAGAGISLAVYPLLMLWTDVAGAHLGPWNAWLPVILGAAALAWRGAIGGLRQGRPGGPASADAAAHESSRTKNPTGAIQSAPSSSPGLAPQPRPERLDWRRLTSAATGADVALLVVIVFLFVGRLLVVRGLEAPSWGDSVQHVAITQLLLDHGGLFTSWQPYAPYTSLTVHFGFSAFAALLSWAGGFSATQATLLAGQVINALAALTLYPLAMRISGGNRWAGTGAVLVAGLLSPMPAYYVNWGRFAQMSGQVILPVALWLLCQVLAGDRFNWRTVLLAAAAAAGMTLTYLRMPWYYACFVLAWLIGYGLPHWRLDLRQWLRRGLWLAALGAVLVLLVYPWRSRLSGSNLEVGLATGLTAPASALAIVTADYQAWKGLAEYLPRGLQALAVMALVWSLARRRWTVAAVGLWAAVLSSLVAGRLIHLPGSNMIQSFAVIIALYIPAGLLIGWLLGEVVQQAGRAWRQPAQFVTAVSVLVLAGWGGAGQLNVVQPQFVLVTRPDMRAMDWIRANTPADARFLVEGFRIYEGASAVGSDAGWYIPLLAGRANTMPPQYAMLNEAPSQPGYTQRVVDLVAQLENVTPGSPRGLAALCREGITHVYVGQGQGKVGTTVKQLFSPGDLRRSPSFEEIYHRDQVYIFRLAPDACKGSQS